MQRVLIRAENGGCGRLTGRQGGDCGRRPRAGECGLDLKGLLRLSQKAHGKFGSALPAGAEIVTKRRYAGKLVLHIGYGTDRGYREREDTLGLLRHQGQGEDGEQEGRDHVVSLLPIFLSNQQSPF
jgi:hypothetical protein